MTTMVAFILLLILVLGFVLKMLGKDARLWDVAVFVVLLVLLLVPIAPLGLP